jgi:hypothetical protein
LSCHLHPSLEGSLLFRFSDSNFVFIADFILYLFTKVISGWYKFWSCSLYTCTFIINFCHFCSNILYCILLSNTSILCYYTVGGVYFTPIQIIVVAESKCDLSEQEWCPYTYHN